jgi:uncharacterized protein (TIGR03083 family)
VALDREQLLGVAHAERARLGRTVQYADPSTWEQPSAAAGWWNRDVMAHLAAGDTAAAQLVAGEPAEELEEFRAKLDGAPFDLDAFNAWTVSRRADLAVRDVLDTWGRAAESFLAHAALLGEKEWASARFAWFAGDIAARYLVQSRLVEWFLHGEDMRAANGVGEGWQQLWQHWPVHLTIDLAVRMLPWALGRRGLDLSGLTIKVVAEGTGEGVWHWGLGTGEVPMGDEKADGEIVGRAPQLALVAGRRLGVDDVLESGNVVLGGDAELAETVLRTLHAYP